MSDESTAVVNPTDDATPFESKPWLIRTSHVGDHLEKHVVATVAQRDWLVETLEILSCEAVTCDIDLKPGRRGRFVGELHVQAEFTQNCVITLETFVTHVDETIAAEFWPAKQIDAWNADRGQEAEINEDTPDPEPIAEDRLPIGQLVHQAIVMAVDVHPRKPGVEFGSLSTETPEQIAAEKPFAGLAQLRDKLS